MLQNIPLELRKLDHWVCAGPDKVPLNPRNARLASPTDPTTWGTFQEACQSGYPHIGLVFTKEDPYAIIDLDDPFKRRDKTIIKPGDEDWPHACDVEKRHAKMVASFESYTETSMSGQGVHITILGAIPHGVNRDKVELYSDARYMIFTGNVIKNLAIADYDETINAMFDQMSPTASFAELDIYDETTGDTEILEMAMNAANADKFNQLCNGGWQSEYPSQSEADFALLSIFAFYTKNDEQVRRLFRCSALGKRAKAIKNDTYINFALKKIRGNQPPPVDFSNLNLIPKEEYREEVPSPLPPVTPAPKVIETPNNPEITFPPGLVGEIAEYIYRTAVRPVPEIALAAAIGLTGGVCGRSYNISGTGLNQYIILLARTGAGKEGIASGIDSIIAATKQNIPTVDDFIGPSAFASGQALIRSLDEKPCFVSILGEIGLTLQQLCDSRANSNQIMLRKVLLDLYSKSGWNKVLRSSVYSDVEKNTKVVQAPNVTILGEATPSTFYDGLDQEHISEGLIPRFLIIEYLGPRPPRNPQAFMPPGEELIQKFSDLVTVALTTAQNNTCSPVQTTADALKLFDTYDTFADKQINSSLADADIQLWNRAHLKSLKLAALIAVGQDPHQPIIQEEVARWSIDFVTKDIDNLLKRFRRGDVGTGDHKQEADVKKAITTYLAMSPKERVTAKASQKIANQPIIPYSYLKARLRMRAAFKNDRRGMSRALRETIEEMVKTGVIQEVPSPQVRSKFGLTTQLFVIGDEW